LEVVNFAQILCRGICKFRHGLLGRLGGIMAVRKLGKCKEYERYARHCLELVRIATNRNYRIIQREMAAEWFKLADIFSATEELTQ